MSKTTAFVNGEEVKAGTMAYRCKKCEITFLHEKQVFSHRNKIHNAFEYIRWNGEKWEVYAHINPQVIQAPHTPKQDPYESF